MRGIRRLLVIAAAFALLGACATGPAESDFDGPVGSGDRLRADSIEMTAPDNWADYAALAEFVPGQMYDGVEAIEFQIGYGETSVAWNLDDLPAGEEVLIGMDLNIDFFGTQTALALAALPGTLTAEDAQDPREEINAAVAAEFADADPGKPDTTNGWQTVTLPVTADADGNATLFLIVGRAAENPPLVFGAFTNPTVIE